MRPFLATAALLLLSRAALADAPAMACLAVRSAVDAGDRDLAWIVNDCQRSVDFVARWVESGTGRELYSLNYAPPRDHAVEWSFGGHPPVLVAACYTGEADCDPARLALRLRQLNDPPPGACRLPCPGHDAVADAAWRERRAALEAALLD